MITKKRNYKKHTVIDNNMVGMRGLEPRTSSLSEKRSNQLSYTPERENSINFSSTVKIYSLTTSIGATDATIF